MHVQCIHETSVMHVAMVVFLYFRVLAPTSYSDAPVALWAGTTSLLSLLRKYK